MFLYAVVLCTAAFEGPGRCKEIACEIFQARSGLGRFSSTASRERKAGKLPYSDPLCHSSAVDGDGLRAIIVEPEQMQASAGKIPTGSYPPLTEARVDHWLQQWDYITCPYQQCFSGGRYCDQKQISQHTKLGGAPWWWQGPAGPKVPPWRFVLQLTASLNFAGPAPPLSKLQTLVHYWDRNLNEVQKFPLMERDQHLKLAGKGLPDPYNLDIVTAYPDSWSCELGGPLRADPVGYVFVNTEVNPPKAMFLTQA